MAFKRSKPLGLSGKSPHLRVVFSAKTLCKPAPLPLFCYKKESAYSDLWTHKKNVAMDKQKVNTTSSMNSKGYSSSSHYRINPTAEKSEQVLAIKFVQWDVPPLESLCNSKVYLLRVKLNRGEMMSREEKNWLCEAVNSNTYFRTAVPLQGWRFDFIRKQQQSFSNSIPIIYIMAQTGIFFTDSLFLGVSVLRLIIILKYGHFPLIDKSLSSSPFRNLIISN